MGSACDKMSATTKWQNLLVENKQTVTVPWLSCNLAPSRESGIEGSPNGVAINHFQSLAPKSQTKETCQHKHNDFFA